MLFMDNIIYAFSHQPCKDKTGTHENLFLQRFFCGEYKIKLVILSYMVYTMDIKLNSNPKETKYCHKAQLSFILPGKITTQLQEGEKTSLLQPNATLFPIFCTRRKYKTLGQTSFMYLRFTAVFLSKLVCPR